MESPTGQESISAGSSYPARFSDAIDSIGMGPFQARLILVCGMGWLIDAIEVLVVAFVLDDVAATFQLGSFAKGLVGSASFFVFGLLRGGGLRWIPDMVRATNSWLGMSFGAIFWSVYADKCGRRKAFVFSLCCIFFSGVASALAPSFYLLLVFRAVVGFGVGGNIPVSMALVTEFLPTSHRAKVLCHVSGVFWAGGLISASVLGLVLSHVLGPGQEESMWRWFLGIAAVPAAAVLVMFRMLPESPRYLSVMGRHDEAAKVLEEVARVNGKAGVLGFDPPVPTGTEERIRLQSGPTSDIPAVAGTGLELRVDRSSGGGNGDKIGDQVGPECGAFYGHGEEAEHAEAGDVRELFHTPILRRVTLCIWMVWLFVNTSYYGLTFLLPKYYKDIAGGDDFEYILSAVVGVSFVVASFVSLWLCSEERLGRVGTIKWSSLATAVLILIMGLAYGSPALFVPVSILTMLAIAVPSIIKYVITPEMYATKYRAVGLGSASVWTRIGGMVAPVVAVVLYDKGPLWPLAVFCPAMILVAIFAAMIPVETAGRKLDDDSWDRRSLSHRPMATPGRNQWMAAREGSEDEEETAQEFAEGGQGEMM